MLATALDTKFGQNVIQRANAREPALKQVQPHKSGEQQKIFAVRIGLLKSNNFVSLIYCNSDITINPDMENRCC